MRQFVTIATNAFMELIRQPIFLLLMTSSAVFCVFLASIPYFGFGDDPKLVKDSVLAVTLLVGLLGAVLSASNSLARELRTGTALAVLSKPVGRAIVRQGQRQHRKYHCGRVNGGRVARRVIINRRIF